MSEIPPSVSAKNKIRNFAAQYRKSLNAVQKRMLDREICRQITGTSVFLAADTVLLYASLPDEIQLTSCVDAALTLGKRIAYPRCSHKGREMTFHAVGHPRDLIPGKYGIPEPAHTAPALTSDELIRALCIVPALACDLDGNRIGYGGGYYDRFLARFSVRTVCAVYSSLLFAHLPCEATDRPADAIITEKGVWWTRADQKDS